MSADTLRAVSDTRPDFLDPHEHDHTHPDVSAGWLRPAVFGGMDGLVSNMALIAGIGAAGAAPTTVVLAGVAGLVAGACSMAIGEYLSVRTQNEQLFSEMEVEKAAHDRNPDGEERELALHLQKMGMSEVTALTAAKEIHQNPRTAAQLHITQELGLDPESTAHPVIAAVSSFVTFSLGAAIPLLPYMLGYESLALGLGTGAIGLVLAGAASSSFTRRNAGWSALRQLLLGGIAVAVTYGVGLLFGIGIPA